MTDTLHVRDIPGPILVVAPHPDDDILSSGGLIQIALRLKKPVYVLFITNGDANRKSVRDYLHRPLTPNAFRRLGCVRHAEAIRAEGFLGVPSHHLFFLGFPDGTMYGIATDKQLFRVHRSPFTQLFRAAYPFSFIRNAPYSHQAALILIERVLQRVNPQTVILNLGVDIHPDHQATRILMLEAIQHLDMHPRILSYLIHFPNWPSRRGLLRPPANVHIPGAVSLPLTHSEVIRTRIAYSIHRSQATLRLNNFNLIRSNELFWTTPHRKHE